MVEGAKMKDTKTYLGQIRLLDVRINAKIAEMERIRDIATKVTTAFDSVRVSGGGNDDKLGDAVSRLVDIQSEINADIDAYINRRAFIVSILDKIEDAEELAVLHKRYIEFKRWEQISEEMGYSQRNVTYIHGRALLSIRKLLEEADDEQEAM
jgi:DNA-directed RNA polymerase specialized sigma subunit